MRTHRGARKTCNNKTKKEARRSRFWPLDALRNNKARAKKITPQEEAACARTAGHIKRATKKTKKKRRVALESGVGVSDAADQNVTPQAF